MSQIVDTLVEMGFNRNRAELAVSKTNADDVYVAMDWILTHEEQPETQPENTLAPAETSKEAEETTETQTEESQVAKSFKCEECGKLFNNQTEVEFHATKTGHGNFSESTEEKKPLTEEEKKDQLAKIESKLRQRRLEREAREKVEELEREKNRIKSGKEMLEAKKKHEELEIKKMVELKKREKEEERLAKQRVREQIEHDKQMRRAKFGGQIEEPAPVIKESPPPQKLVVSREYTEVKLQIRLTNGNALSHTFAAKEPLSAVRLFVELNRTDEPGPFLLMVTCPRKVFAEEDYEKPLNLLGLAPSAVITVSKV